MSNMYDCLSSVEPIEDVKQNVLSDFMCVFYLTGRERVKHPARWLSHRSLRGHSALADP